MMFIVGDHLLILKLPFEKHHYRLLAAILLLLVGREGFPFTSSTVTKVTYGSLFVLLIAAGVHSPIIIRVGVSLIVIYYIHTAAVAF